MPTVKKSFISRENSILQKQIDALNLEDNKRDLESTEKKKAVGQATEMDVLTAKAQVDAGELTLKGDESTIRKTAELLQVSLGWKADASPVFPEIPGVEESAVQQISLAEDSKKALENNFSLQMNTRKRDLSTGDANREDLEKIQSDMLSRYQSLKQAMDAKKQAVSAEANAKAAYEKAERSLQLGSVSVKARDKAKTALDVAVLQKRQAELKLTEEYLDYQAGVAGLATAE